MPTRGEARIHVIVLAVILWGFAASVFLATPGDRAFTGRLKTGDFVHFYTLGTAALRGAHGEYDNGEALHRIQTEVLPASDRERYLPVYPPQTALAFAPFALLPYSGAYAAWAAVLVGVYGWAVFISWRPVRHTLDGVLVALAAAAFPPFWNLVLHGQTTAFPLLGFFLGWLALEHRRPWLAGAAFGLIAVKPQFGVLLAVVLIASRQWAAVGGVMLAVLAQFGVLLALAGPEPLVGYVSTIRAIPQMSDLLEPYPYYMHSLRTITRLLPGAGGTLLWAVLSVSVASVVVRVWLRPGVPIATRMGLLVLGSVLINPHVSLYDLTILALPIIWCGGWLCDRYPVYRAEFCAVLYGLFALTLWPTAGVVWIQGSVLFMVWLFWRLSGLALDRRGLLSIRGMPVAGWISRVSTGTRTAG